MNNTVPMKFKALKFNTHVLTDDAILQARQWYIDNCNECINGAKNKEFHVNDLESYIADEQAMIDEYTNWEFRVWFGFLQRAYYYQTGLSIALLP